MLSKTGSNKNWFKDWFGQEYVDVYAHRDEQDALNLVRLILKHIPIRENTKILDAACGNGRHACAMAKYLDYLFGIDLSLFLLRQVRQNCHFKIVRGDIRALPFKKEFDALLNLFTSFGYFFEEQDHLLVLQEFHKVLKPGGFFFFDFLNADYVQKYLKETSERWIDSKKIVEHRRINNGRVEKTISIENQGKVQEFIESVRMFTKDELLSMVASAGFTVIKTMGDYHGASLSKLSPRLILLLKKGKA
ncbi:MAG: class I SAM-dependent methyltransferase [Caldisericaceae bacterium]|nr:class I SAM-dependent methyltransferase [Caldisericaceae bacterium]